MSFKLLSTVVALATTVSAFAAEPFETIETNDGSVYMGHTSGQLLDSRTPTTYFVTDSAIRVVPANKILSASPVTLGLDEISSEAWRNWFAAHPKLVRIDRNGRKTVVMHRVDVKGKGHSGLVFLLEKGPKHYKFYTNDNARDTICDDSIKTITYATRDALDLNGTKDEITTVNGSRYEGQIAMLTKRDGEYYTGIRNSAGTIELIPNREIAQKRVMALNPDQLLIEQVPYLDEFDLDSPVTGIITMRNGRPSDKSKPYYMVYDVNGGTEKRINMGDVKVIRRKHNDSYKPQKDVIITNDFDIMANAVPLTAALYDQYQDNKTGLDGFVLKDNVVPTRIVIENDEPVELQMRDLDVNNMLYVIQIDKRQLNDKDPKARYYFSYQDLVNRTRMPVKTFVSPNGNKMVSYALTNGTYLIYRNNDRAAFLINVEY